MVIDEETELHSGTTVKIPLSDDEHGNSWSRTSEQEFILDVATQELSFFDNVIIKSKTRNSWGAGKYNEGKIIDCGEFLFRTSCQYSDEMHLVIGKVCYSIDWKQLDISSINVPVGIKFNIGDFQVNMTREDIIYDDEAKETIKKAIDNVKNKLQEIYRDRNKDFTELLPYLKARDKFKNNRKATIQFIEDDEDSILDITPIFKEFDKNITFKTFKDNNLPEPDLRANVFNFIYIVNEYEDKLLKYKKGYSPVLYDYSNRYSGKKFILINNDSPNKIEAKDFIKYHDSFTLLKIKNLKQSYKDILHLLNLQDNKNKTYKAFDNFGDLMEFHEHSFKKQRPEDLKDPLEIKGCTNLGWSIKVYNYYKIVKEEFYKLCEELNYSIIDYNTFKIPQEWINEQKQIAKALKNNYRSLSGQIKVVDLSNNSSEKTIHLQNLKNNSKLIFYGHIREKQNLLTVKHIMGCFNRHNDTFKDSTYRVWQILKIDEKTMENIPNTVHVETFLKNPNRLILKFLAACDFQQKYYKFTGNSYLNNLKKINNYYAKLLDDLHNDIRKEFSYSRIESFISDTKLYEEVKKVHNYNQFLGSRAIYDKYTYRIKQLDDFFKGVELLQNTDLMNESKNIPYLVDYLKLKGKKVNLEHYNLSKNPVLLQKETENKFNGWGIIYEPIESNPEITRNDILHVIYKNENTNIINNLEQTTDELVQKMA